MGIFLFAIQIYCDFSGYSDIAIGSARLMGFDLMQNFDRPYLSRSISEFWRKWHISLSTWFRDYFYLPIGGSRRSPWRNHLNVFLTFLVSGLWHGANWTFLIWGAFHGTLLVADRILRPNASKTLSTKGASSSLPIEAPPNSPPIEAPPNSPPATATGLPRLRYWPQIALTFTLVCIGWVFFRAENLAIAGQIFSNLLDFSQGPASVIIRAGNNPLGILNFAILCLAMGLFLLSGFLPRNLKLRYNLGFLILVSLIVLFLGRNAGNEFIYFQF
jgi:alginate O-acetyltransferase complex protein AlgI